MDTLDIKSMKNKSKLIDSIPKVDSNQQSRHGDM